MFDVRGEVSRRCSGRRADVVPARVHTTSLVAAAMVGIAAAVAIVVPLLVAVPVLGALAVLLLILQRRALADLAAGVTLLVARPYDPGEQIRLRVDGDRSVDAELLQVRLLRTVLCTGSGMLEVRNSHLLRATPDYDPTA